MKKGFTLAEVLITLGVIGVVAALTMPSLISNYQKKMWVAQLQKSVSTLEQGFQKMLADDGVDSLGDTAVFALLNNQSACGSLFPQYCKEFKSALTSYFKIAEFINQPEKTYRHKTLSTKRFLSAYIADNDEAIVFNDGFILMQYGFSGKGSDCRADCNVIKANGGHYCKTFGSFRIKVNGLREPNTWGRDVFNFVLGDNGKLYPESGRDYALCFSGDLSTTTTANWKTWPDVCGVAGEKLTGNVTGYGCAARIIENGWLMDY